MKQYGQCRHWQKYLSRRDRPEASRQPGKIIGIDKVDEMLDACRENLKLAGQQNYWFNESFVDLRKGDAFYLPVEDETVDVTAQNCLFNIFQSGDLTQALRESYRILKPQGRLVMSDPISEEAIPQHLREDEKLRAQCLSGAIPLKDYINAITDIGFGTVEVRAKRPYRLLDPHHYGTDHPILIESVEVCAIKDPVPSDGPCVFTGKSAIYFGNDEYFDDGKGHTLVYNQPLAVCDKTAQQLSDLNRDDIYISLSTYFYDGGGCC